MPWGRKAWAAILLTAAALEVWGVRHPKGNMTLSELTRWAFQTDTKVGKASFLVALAVFTRHIFKGGK